MRASINVILKQFEIRSLKNVRAGFNDVWREQYKMKAASAVKVKSKNGSFHGYHTVQWNPCSQLKLIMV